MTEKRNNIGKVPNLRFEGFEGEWAEKKLGDVARKINSGKTPLGGESVYTTTGVLFIRSQNINKDRLQLANPVFISEEINNGMKNSVVLPFDILLNITGASLGRSCVVPEDFTIGNVNQHVCIIRLNEEHIPRFIQPFLSSGKGQNILQSLQTGSGREGLNFESVKGINIYLPSLPEQKEIADFLTLIDERIVTQSKIIKELATLSKSLRECLFTRKWRFKNHDGNDFPDWEFKKLGKVYSFKMTNSFSRDHLNYENGSVKNIHYGDIHTKFQTLFDVTKEIVPFINSEISIGKISKDNYCKDGDIIFADASEDLNDVGKSIEIVKLNGEKLVSGLHTILARPDSTEMSVGFGGYLFQSSSVRLQIQKEAQGTKVLSISAKRLSNIKISIPCLEEQMKIADFLSSLNEKIEIEKRVFQQYEIQKKYLLQNMFI